jgi:ferritin-like metal-binding protein YciE
VRPNPRVDTLTSRTFVRADGGQSNSMATTSTRNGNTAPTIDTGDLAQLEAGRNLVVQQLNEAHATEQALVTTLTAHISMTPKGSYRTLLERHLEETREQSQAIQRRLGELNQGSNIIAAGTGLVESLIGQVLALSKGPFDLLRGKSGEEKLLKNAKDECATEALEIATYDSLITLARAVGDETTAKLAETHRAQEERMLEGLREHIPVLTQATVLAQAGGKPSYDIGSTGAADTVKSARKRAEKTVKDATGRGSSSSSSRTRRSSSGGSSSS